MPTPPGSASTIAASTVEGEAPARRRRATRARSLRVGSATRAELRRAERALGVPDPHSADRPRTREECRDGPRPCPFVACRHHLYIDVSPSTGTIKLNFPDLEVWELAESCALDVADRGAHAPEQASVLLNVTRERIRQIEALALGRLGALRDVRSLRDVPDDPPGFRPVRPRR